MRPLERSGVRLRSARVLALFASTIALAASACVPADDQDLLASIDAFVARAAAASAASAAAASTLPPTPTPGPSSAATPPAAALDGTPDPTPTPTPPAGADGSQTPGPAAAPSPTASPMAPAPPTGSPGLPPSAPELEAVSAAVGALMADNGLPRIPHPVTSNEAPCATGTQDMTAFPDVTSAVETADKLIDPSGNAYTDGVPWALAARSDFLGDKGGYVLVGHDRTADGLRSGSVDYLSFARTSWCYVADSDGYVHQLDPAGVETPRPPRPTPTPTPVPTPTPTPTPAPTPTPTVPADLIRGLRASELVEISDAVSLLMRHAGLGSIPNPVAADTAPCTTGTRDMSAFPDTASGAGTADKLTDPFGRAYEGGDRDGYVLVGHDVVANNQQTDFLQSYVRFTGAIWCYTADPDGRVHQYDEAGELLGARTAPRS